MKLHRLNIVFANIFLSAGILAVDALTPLGIADGMIYAAVVLLTIWIDDKQYTLFFSALAAVLIIIGYFLSPPGELHHIAVSNRILSLGMIAVCATIIMKYKNTELVVRNQQQELEELTRNLQRANTMLESRVKDRTLILEEALKELEGSQQELHNSLQHERELNELKSRFVSMASHEFRTPLATILSSLSLISKYRDGKDIDKQEKHIHRIKSSVTHLTDLLNDVLSVSKLEEGRMSCSIDSFSIDEVAGPIIQEMQAIAKPGQQLFYEHSGQKEVLCDRKILHHILLNLISNAIKFSPEGGSILVQTTVHDTDFGIRVEDHGIGISEQDQKHLFERFFRGENATHIQGTGLGLNIVARYVELLNGRIEMTSRLNKGTIISILLPQAQLAPAEDQIPAPMHFPPST